MDAEHLGLPPAIKAGLFDLDGVITQTAKVHFQAWKAMFDTYLEERSEKAGGPFAPFELADYIEYVDGKPREDGVRSFLESRLIAISDSLIRELSLRKDRIFLDLIHRDGVDTYEGSVRYLHAARKAGLKLAVVSSSKNTTEVLRAANLHDIFDAQVDGVIALKEHLKGKPAPDTYLRAATMLNTPAHEAAVYEDAIAGVEAGRAGSFGLVVGIDRNDRADELEKHGADIVVKDLSDLMSG
ncbi:MAG TPA: beta-phosphoglucomutase family hydrolase [Candidatus Dormibacteraeota bacterium]|nr:beta-phosphoglucomutase family hydrolase [Candidatus Dormibacteraeota bacterium]